jgi:hypothetical protein
MGSELTHSGRDMSTYRAPQFSPRPFWNGTAYLRLSVLSKGPLPSVLLPFSDDNGRHETDGVA